MTESREFLKFPDLMPVDHGRHCQLYTNGKLKQYFIIYMVR